MEKKIFQSVLGGDHFWQHDTGQSLKLLDETLSFDTVHFEDRAGNESVSVPLSAEKTVAVPDSVLETEGSFKVWCYDSAEKRTVGEDSFKVIQRQDFIPV